MSTLSATRTVPFFAYNRFFTDREQEYTEAIVEVLRRGAFILQKDVTEFERALADYLGVKHAIGMSNCTDALIVALKCAGVGPGDEVIFPSHTFVASPSSIHWCGATPVPVECGVDHLIDAEAVRAAVTKRTKAIMPVSLNGRTCAFDPILEIAAEHGLAIVEDSAQALGSKYKGKHAGTFGVAGTFSFYPAKILGCFGDGGAIVTDDDAVARKARLFRDHGRDEKTGEVVQWGFNFRLDNVQAAILHLQFRDYDKTVARRREVAALYQEGLGDLAEVALPPAPDSDPDHFDVYQNYEVEAERRDDLRIFLKEQGIGTLVQWGGKPVHQFQGLGFDVSLPRTERLFERCLLLPCNLFVSDDDVRYVVAKVREFYGR
ncbi:MAG: DegT/DnrJ/EryC1/StrS family aminotransferase [Fimbriimonadaceae bacterium]|nr:DegT/DnrJ/EryC1/StrS family aminotransferase [Fimbriimonadaceae bacterium]QYK56089.1 MAG: DegT/DnrJ/EryC1/StrS family aminotransferase [Fimbriimonadaceae bacterium]